MVTRRFSPGIRTALRIDIAAAVVLAVFAGLRGPSVGLLLGRDLGAPPFQLSVMSAATGASLLLSLAWAQALGGRAPLPYLVWPAVVARGAFLLVPLAAGAWSFAGLVVASSVFRAAARPAQAAVVERAHPRAERARALGILTI